MTNGPGGGHDGSMGALTLRRVLVANRGEIAVRIVRALRDAGIESIVAFSEADRGSLATVMADRAVCIGPARAAESYLDTNAILAAASALGADAIHPGYGFLAERASFATACVEAGITFIGPRASSIEAMGDKVKARRIASDVGVPVIPGTFEPVSPDDAAEVAESIGYPVILKAAAGGGGRGMRLVSGADELRSVVGQASAEAQASFGDGSVYVEKYLANARHIEVQIAFDEAGEGVHLGERDCTVQRRFQKLIEEAPSPVLTATGRQEITDAALRLARAVGYLGVGTIEFLHDQDSGASYFIEANTRLQVEHPVTEAVTGIDLVALQLRIAAGQPLGLSQSDVVPRGHAIEFRVNAEDASNGFQPAAGTVERWSVPLGPGVRVDTHVQPGYRVPPFYDSLLAKLIVSGADRPETVARARRAIREFDVAGVATTLPFHAWVLDQAPFLTSAISTTWAEGAWKGGRSA
ncbi:MAG TPA: acetyl-CoA carboxylase biotin carboxylase subunit [Candidatus Saccharimonadales bacterium]|nr:acetyl-CoA carboxylase biotin carboxylase subunit [Candidatus Saccharimonadales bacterium]